MIESQPTIPMQISETEVDYWRGEVDASIKFRKDEFLNRINYDRLVKYFEGLQASDNDFRALIGIIDEFSPAIASVIANTYYQNPSISVEATQPKAEGMIRPPMLYMIQNPDFRPFSMVELMDGALKYSMDKGGMMKLAMQLGIFDLLVAGFTVIEENILTTPIWNDMQEEEPQQAGSFIEDAGKFLKDPLGMNPENKMSVELNKQEVEEKIAKERGYQCYSYKSSQFTKRWCPTRMLFDSRADYMSESRFMGKEIFKSLAEFNAMYPNLKNKIGMGSQRDLSYQSGRKDQDRKGVCLYELEILKEDRVDVLVLADGLHEAVDYYTHPVTTNGFFLKYGCLDKYGKIYPMSRGAKAKKFQDQLNQLVSRHLETTLRANRKVAYHEQGLTEIGKARMDSGDVFALVPKKTPASVFETMPQPAETQDNPFLQDGFRNAINKSIGVSELGKTGKSQNDLLGQDMLEQQAYETQTSQIQDALEDIVNQVIDTKKDIIMQLADDMDYFKVTGLSGGNFWYDPAMGPIPDLAKGNYLVKANVISAARPNPMRDKAEKIGLSDYLLRPDVQAYLMQRGKKTNLAPIESAIKQFGEHPEAILEDMEPEPPPMMPQSGEPPEAINQGGEPPIPEEVPNAVL